MQTIKIGEFEYSRTKIKNNILRVYADSLESEKNDWYREANQWAVDVSNFLLSFKRLNVSVKQVLGITSALSPLKEWEKNKELTVDFILSGDCGHMKNNKIKAWRILHHCETDDDILKVLNGPKTSRFYMNMMYSNDATSVTVDRHAIAIAIGRTATDVEQVLTIPKYTFIENCYKISADVLGLTPLHLQSITWQAWKRMKANK
jgi:hypothetical protein